MFIKNYGILLGMALTVQGLLTGCSNKVSTEGIDEVAQQVGELMASVDEFGGSGGTLSQHQKSFQKMEDRLDPHFTFPGLLPNAFAASCISSATFSGCDNAQRTLEKRFNNCSLGLATFNGSVSLTWGGSGSGCSLGIPTGAGATITRVPEFSVTGLRGATLKVFKESPANIGQRLTYVSGIGPSARFTVSSDGIRRVFSLPDESRLLDYTSSTPEPLGLTGSGRTGRRLSGGILRVKNNLEDLSCDFTPTNVTWSLNCSCPVSGSWQATCSDGSSSSIEITGCGSAEFTFGSETQTISFDRCFEQNG
jgi:hypothetical protein